MKADKPPFYKKALLAFIGFTFLEPLFEILCLLMHNLVFQNIADLSFNGVSLSSFLVFILGLTSLNPWQIYFLELPSAALIGVFLASFRLFDRAWLRKTLYAALGVWLLFTVLIFSKIYYIMNWHEPIVFLSYILSSFYWFISVATSWMVLRMLRIL